MGWFARLGDKAGSVGALVSAMGCAGCFPALGSLGAAIGLGFLSQYEGVFIRYLLPLFAGIALLANVISGRRHGQWFRGALGVTGPLLVLAAVFVMVVLDQRSGFLLYPGLVLMVAVAIWDLISRPRKAGTTTDDKTDCC
ncbi:organomercurial transporter MerC [Pseudoxanthomonas sp. SE1]|uniref:organomercurial transporter MerC n=1 Tax=Pseudoxanthomonas sp. SE1 TaxID=1664560 RepID=UPI00240E37FD|nr:organomercurial transporter MerC [Pseudoxanthomonas sp. SE1]WFC43898.1 organomercurial transporter MerC [Pseudoxanthomonas sp. SE1]WFC43913.1 organomercurial transporter MerC [Pseudoxanthomonas sp. SE1]